MAELGVHEQRRYSAVTISHPALGSVKDLRGLLGRRIGKAKHLSSVTPNWTVDRFEFYAYRNFYPATRLAAAGQSLHDRERDNLYSHDVYIAINGEPRAADGHGYAVVASPYVRVLVDLLRQLRDALPAPAPQFFAIDMEGAYSTLASVRDRFSATKVTWQMLGDTGLELVSLSGASPLHSSLHNALRGVASPYSVRVEVRVSDLHCRVSADRHGNLWWYLAAEDRVSIPLTFVDLLNERRLLRLGRTSPLDRVDGADDR